MTQKVTELLRELIEYTKISDDTISEEAKNILSNMREEIRRIDASDDSQKQEKMIALFIGGTIAALKQDDMKYSYPTITLYPKNTVEIAAGKWSQKKINLASPEFMYVLGKEALLNLPHTFCGDLFKFTGMLINAKECVPFFPKLCIHADKVDTLVTFCLEHKDNLESPDPVIKESIPCEKFLGEFVTKHNESLRCGLFGGFFNRTNLKQYDKLAPENILAHAKQRTFFGFKNRTRLILEEMEVMNSDGVLIKKVLSPIY